MTAVEWLVDQLKEHSLIKPSLESGFEILSQQAKALEAEQKIEFAINTFHNRNENESIFVAAERTLNNK